MKTQRIWMWMVLLAMLVSACGGATKEQRKRAEQLIESVYGQKDYNRLLTLADSLELTGALSAAKANYWRGYAYSRLKEPVKATDSWQKSMAAAVVSGSKADMDIYVKSASYLANLLCLSGDYSGTLQVAQPAVERLEAEKRDTTSDYVNLLIYIGLSQVSIGQSAEEAANGFMRASRKHRENIERNHSDKAYRDAIAGLVNVAYYCVNAGRYEEALFYTGNFGELLGEYEQRPGIDNSYVDRQVGRYAIYKAQALEHLGRESEAKEVYDAFLATKFSQSHEGQTLAAKYQGI